jgi:hypothetical protein
MMQLAKPSLSQIIVILNQKRQQKNRRRQQNKHQRVYYCFLFYSHREPVFHCSFNVLHARYDGGRAKNFFL